MSATGITREERLAAVAKATSFEEFLEALGPAPNAVLPMLPRAALARTFDEPLYSAVLCAAWPDGEPPSFADFIADPSVLPVSGASGWHRLRPDVEARELLLWQGKPDELRQLSSRLTAWLREHASPDLRDEMLLPHLLFDDSATAALQLEARCVQADAKFELARLEGWLGLVRSRMALVPQADPVRPVFERWQARLAARRAYERDYYQSATYFRRHAVHDAIGGLLTEGRQWVGEVHAAGGLGKSMFAKAWISRDLVPAGIPVARVDFDAIEFRHLSSQPWFVLLSICRQLAPQIPDADFTGILGNGDSWEPFLSRRVQDARIVQAGAARDGDLESWGKKFADSLPDAVASKPLVLVFDTTEEPYLHALDMFLPLVKMFAAAHERCSGLRVLFSGRYDLLGRTARQEERVPGLRAFLGGQLQEPREIEPFSDDEARDYLANYRSLKERPELVDAIVESSGGIPFKLALWADDAAEDSRAAKEDQLTPEMVRKSPRIDLHFLISRVIQRIPATESEAPVRWAVRYAAAFRRLTSANFSTVLVPVLKQAAEQLGKPDALDEPDLTLPELWRHRAIWDKPGSAEALWKALQKYANQPGLSWLQWSAGENENLDLWLHQNVAYPMRDLLRGQKVWRVLHEQALEVLRSAAVPESDPAQWAALSADMVFHAFQLGPDEGVAAWKQARAEAADRPLFALEVIAETILSTDFFEDPETSQSRLWPETGKKLVPDFVAAQAWCAKAEAAASAAVLAQRPAERVNFWNKAAEAWRKARQTSPSATMEMPVALRRVLSSRFVPVSADFGNLAHSGNPILQMYGIILTQPVGLLMTAAAAWIAALLRPTPYGTMLSLVAAHTAEAAGALSLAVERYGAAARRAQTDAGVPSRLPAGAVLDQAANGLQRLGALGASAKIYTSLLSNDTWRKQALEARRQRPHADDDEGPELDAAILWRRVGELGKARECLGDTSTSASFAYRLQGLWIDLEMAMPERVREASQAELERTMKEPEIAELLKLKAECATALGLFREAQICTEDGMRRYLALGRQSKAAYLALIRVRQSLDILGDFKSAQSLLNISVFNEPGVREDLWLSALHRLLAIQLKLRTRESTQDAARQEFARLWRDTRKRLNPRRLAYLLAWALVDEIGIDHGAREYCHLLSRIDVATARLSALLPFRHGRTGSGPKELTDEIFSLFDELQPRLDTERIFFPTTHICLADLARWLGDLNRARMQLRRYPRLYDWMRFENTRAWIRLGVVDDDLTRIASNLLSLPDVSPLALIITLEFAERADLRQLPAHFTSAFRRLPAQAMNELAGTAYEPRLLEFRARTASSPEERNSLFSEAAAKWNNLANAAAAVRTLSLAEAAAPPVDLPKASPKRPLESVSFPTVRLGGRQLDRLLDNRESSSSAMSIYAWAWRWLEEPDSFLAQLCKVLKAAFKDAGLPLRAAQNPPFRLSVSRSGLFGGLPWELAIEADGSALACRVADEDDKSRKVRSSRSAASQQEWDFTIVDAGSRDYPTLRQRDVSLHRVAEASGCSVRPPTAEEKFTSRSAHTEDFDGLAGARVLFLACPVVMQSESAEPYLSLSDRRFSARGLGRQILYSSSKESQDVIIFLQAALPRSPHEARCAVLARNLFAAELFAICESLAIIAGAVPDETVPPFDYADALFENFVQAKNFIELMNWLRLPEHGWAAPATAIFTEAPFDRPLPPR